MEWSGVGWGAMWWGRPGVSFDQCTFAKVGLLCQPVQQLGRGGRPPGNDHRALPDEVKAVAYIPLAVDGVPRLVLIQLQRIRHNIPILLPNFISFDLGPFDLWCPILTCISEQRDMSV
jgi:hypothetical protein